MEKVDRDPDAGMKPEIECASAAKQAGGGLAREAGPPRPGKAAACRNHAAGLGFFSSGRPQNAAGETVFSGIE